MTTADDGVNGPGLGFPRAIYHKQVIREHAGNKFIEALPPLTNEGALVGGLWLRADVKAEDRAQEAFIRLHMIEGIPASFMQPLTDHVLLATQVSAMIRAGYLTRNPASPSFLRNLGLRVAELGHPRRVRSDVAGRGLAVIGMSGVGKSTAIDAVLRTYPRVIWHPELTGPLRTTHQITSLKLVCPMDGSLSALCRSYFLELDAMLGTNYHGLYTPRATVESMRDSMARLAFIHGLGVLVIDEVQNLATAKGVNANTLLNFFLVLRDVLGIPGIVIGTDAAIRVIGATMKQARRHAGQPLFDRMANGPEFVKFCNAMFEAYYLRESLNPTPEFRSKLYDLSQGIADIVIKLFMLAQARALVTNKESIDVATLQVIYDQCLHLLHPHLNDVLNGHQLDTLGYESALREIRGVGLSLVGSPEDASRPISKPRKGATKNLSAEGTNLRGNNENLTIEKSALSTAVAARVGGTSEHAALKAAGFVWDLGAEVVAGL